MRSDVAHKKPSAMRSPLKLRVVSPQSPQAPSPDRAQHGPYPHKEPPLKAVLHPRISILHRSCCLGASEISDLGYQGSALRDSSRGRVRISTPEQVLVARPEMDWNSYRACPKNSQVWVFPGPPKYAKNDGVYSKHKGFETIISGTLEALELLRCLWDFVTAYSWVYTQTCNWDNRRPVREIRL